MTKVNDLHRRWLSDPEYTEVNMRLWKMSFNLPESSSRPEPVPG